jgi:O-antigen/teichoic acid export membrane protein
MSIATALGGITSYAVHMFAKDMPDSEYGAFTTMIQLLNLIAIPAIGLQAVFAVKAAKSKTKEDDLRMVREQIGITIAVITISLVGFGGIYLYGETLVSAFKLPSIQVLAITLSAGIVALLLPMAYGVLQGKQRFLWLGWAMLSLGVVRLATLFGLFRFHNTSLTNGMIAVWAGYAFAFVLAISTAGLPKMGLIEMLISLKRVNWRELTRQFIPLSLGGGAVIYMMSVDMVVVQRFFNEKQTGYYAAAGMIGRALIFFVGPIVAVMFPKLVKSHAEQKPTDVLRFTLLLTAGLCAIAITLGILVPDIPLRIIYDESYLKATPLIPWFIGAMAPLALAAVLVNNLLAQGFYRAVYGLAGICITYTLCLSHFAPKLAEQTTSEFNVLAYISVVKIIGLSNLAFLGVAGIFTYLYQKSQPLSAEEEH